MYFSEHLYPVMMQKIIRIIIVLSLFLSVLGCKKYDPERSFYYWKSVFHLSQKEKNALKELSVQKLYVRFFDVDAEKATGQIIPVATIRFNDSLPENCEIIPVVYLVNQSLKNSPLDKIPDLAEKILKLVNSIAVNNHIFFREFQLDCDWTETTREKYFVLLETVKKMLGNGKKVSATIRLHQIKYRNITGVPPVDRGMLMYYNMGKITASLSHNSIFNTTDAAKYIDFLPDYPLPLDIALPAFSWGIHIRMGKVTELLNNMDVSDFESNSNFRKNDDASYSATGSFFFHGFYFIENDVVKIETVSSQQCLVAAQQLKSKLTRPIGSVAIYHLDSLILTRYEKEDLEKVFDTYR